jgi:hypothetical protein
MSHEHWKLLADAFNPTVGLLAIAVPWIFKPGRSLSRSRYFVAALSAMAVMYLLRAIEHSPEAVLPKTLGVHYSAHTGFAVVALIALSVWRSGFAWPGLAAFSAYGALMVYQHYHAWGDIGATAFLIGATTVFIFSVALVTVGGPAKR